LAGQHQPSKTKGADEVTHISDEPFIDSSVFAV